jgi:hypothetical protein
MLIERLRDESLSRSLTRKNRWISYLRLTAILTCHNVRMRLGAQPVRGKGWSHPM